MANVRIASYVPWAHRNKDQAGRRHSSCLAHRARPGARHDVNTERRRAVLLVRRRHLRFVLTDPSVAVATAHLAIALNADLVLHILHAGAALYDIFGEPLGDRDRITRALPSRIDTQPLAYAARCDHCARRDDDRWRTARVTLICRSGRFERADHGDLDLTGERHLLGDLIRDLGRHLDDGQIIDVALPHVDA